MVIRVKRVYDTPDADDGLRILVERLWPRGLSREPARVDVWAKETAPSAPLRKWYGHEPERWVEFKERYIAELDDNEDGVGDLVRHVASGPATFVFASRETERNSAQVLKAYVESLKKRRGTRG